MDLFFALLVHYTSFTALFDSTGSPPRLYKSYCFSTPARDWKTPGPGIRGIWLPIFVFLSFFADHFLAYIKFKS